MAQPYASQLSPPPLPHPQRVQQRANTSAVPPPTSIPLPFTSTSTYTSTSTAAPGLPPPDPSRVWIPELVARFAAFLPQNDVACGMRLTDRATAAQLRSPAHTTVHLSQPVNPREFARHWAPAAPAAAAAAAAHRLPLSQRLLAVPLTLRSGVMANVELLWAQEAFNCRLPTMGDFEAVAAAGQVGGCRWLMDQGVPCDERVLEAACAAGQRHLVAWLMASGCKGVWSDGAAGCAAAGGHKDLTSWLLQARPTQVSVTRLLEGAATGLDASTFQRVKRAWQDPSRRQPASIAAAAASRPLSQRLANSQQQASVLSAAAASPRDCWRAKVEWLKGHSGSEAVACGGGVCTAAAGAGRPDALERLHWLQGQGFPVEVDAAVAAARAGDAAALRFVLSQGSVREALRPEAARHLIVDVAAAAVSAGCVPALIVLHEMLSSERGAGEGLGGMGGGLVELGGLAAGDGSGGTGGGGVRTCGLEMQLAAAAAGRLDMCAWLAETLGGAAAAATVLALPPALPPATAAGRLGNGAAAGSYTATLREGGGGGGHTTSLHMLMRGAAVRSGSLPLLRWLSERGVRDADGDTSAMEQAAMRGDLALLRFLVGQARRWDGAVFAAAAAGGNAAMLEWLASRGCPMSGVGLRGGDDHSDTAYVRAARNGDIATLRVLRSLGCPWRPSRSLFGRIVSDSGFEPNHCTLAVLRWLELQGCPMDWRAAAEAAWGWEGNRLTVLEWLAERRE